MILNFNFFFFIFSICRLFVLNISFSSAPASTSKEWRENAYGLTVRGGTWIQYKRIRITVSIRFIYIFASNFFPYWFNQTTKIDTFNSHNFNFLLSPFLWLLLSFTVRTQNYQLFIYSILCLCWEMRNHIWILFNFILIDQSLLDFLVVSKKNSIFKPIKITKPFEKQQKRSNFN